MLQDLLKEGFGSEEEYNCAQKIFLGGNKAYNLNIAKESLNIAKGFGGGMCIEDACGAATGAVMVLSYMFSDKEGVELKPLVQEFLNKFSEEKGSLNCKTLKGSIPNYDEVKCKDVILKSAEILDVIVERER